MNVTTIEQLSKVKSTQIVKFPNFSDGTELVVEVKRPSVMAMAVKGKIPNALLGTVTAMTGEQTKTAQPIKMNDSNYSDIYDFLVNLCSECMVAPTYDEICTYAGGLTDEQLFFMHSYVQGEVEKLKSFRR